MEIICNPDDRIAEIWLTRIEKEDQGMQQKTALITSLYKAKDYTVVVFESGKCDLCEQTKGLLLHNKDGLAVADPFSASNPPKNLVIEFPL